jgi:tripartite-type tricarboxylate transporter receptor subunit TctC
MDVPEVKEKFSAQGFAAAWNTPEAFSAFLQAEVDKWSAVVKSSGTTVD